MKKFLGIVVLGLLLSGNVYAKTIYCYKANKGSEFLNSTVATNLEESEEIYFFEIDDRVKNVEWLKYYYEYKKKIKYKWEDNNIYKFVYKYRDNPLTQQKLKFNKNEILMSWDYKDNKNVFYREYFELDRISGLLLITMLKLDTDGNEITTDKDGVIYKSDDKKFDDFLNIDKLFCENHKGL